MEVCAGVMEKLVREAASAYPNSPPFLNERFFYRTGMAEAHLSADSLYVQKRDAPV